ncbi:uncharacterized protein LOC142590419 [Dermacentor variabilis]|uniref:uncharacterized protein LOC142590419 n=1 Tax=Dermacentor variabilis TaxID=34621 RepID=UPI003F5C4432
MKKPAAGQRFPRASWPSSVRSPTVSSGLFGKAPPKACCTAAWCLQKAPWFPALQLHSPMSAHTSYVPVPEEFGTWVWARRMMGVTTSAAQPPSDVSQVLTSAPAYLPQKGPLCEVFQTWRPPVAPALCATRMTIHRGFCSRKG